MNPQERQRILDEAIRIGEDLLAKAETEAHGMSWASVQQNGGVTNWCKSENIYQGVCGIVLFFVELYKQTGREKYLHAACEGMRWVEWYCGEHPATSYAFLTGRMSVPYTYIQLYNLTRRPDCLTKALAIAKESMEAWETDLSEYINGVGGTLLCLLQLHAATQERWLLDYINKCTGHLLSQAHLGKKGVYWDRSPMSIHGLCGFSHGAAGVGYVLLELGRYFQNDAFYWLAKQAFRYESQFYTPALNNWWDLRKGIYTEEHEVAHQHAYQAGDKDFFTAGANLDAWCHGAAGIGLTRLRAFQLLGNPAYARQARLAIEQTRPSAVKSYRQASFTLCHGGGGNAELLLKAYEIFDDPAYLDMALEVAQQALSAKPCYLSGTDYRGEDTSLFLGNAGIGYFYLRLLQPHLVPSILMPGVQGNAGTDVSAYPNLALTSGDLQQKMLKKAFAHTLPMLRRWQPREVEDYFTGQTVHPSMCFTGDFVRWAKASAALLPAPVSDMLYDKLQLELTKCQMNEDIQSDALLGFKNRQKRQRAQRVAALDDAALFQKVLVVDPDMQLVTTRWPRHAFAPDGQAERGEYPLLLYPSLDFTGEQELSDFTQTVLSVFGEEKTVATAIGLILLHFDDLSPQQTGEVQQLVIAQIRQAVGSGILIEPDQHPLRVLDKAAVATVS